MGLAVAAMASGCVERRFVITTTAPGLPPGTDAGAVVYDEKGLPIGGTPADRQFTYYGKYRFTAMRDGYETQVVERDIQAPWYQWFGIDFISENLVPWTIRDVRHIEIQLQPMQMIPADQVLQQAEVLRQRGQSLGTGEFSTQPIPVPPPGPRQVAGPLPTPP